MTGKDEIQVVVARPGKDAVVESIVPDLKSYQDMVGGYIEIIALPKDRAVMVVNGEGKRKGLPDNRYIMSEQGKLVDTLTGTIFVCGVSKDGKFCSLDEGQIHNLLERFSNRHLFTATNQEVLGVYERYFEKGQEREL